MPILDPCEDPHATITLGDVEVDAAIAPLVKECWRRGFATVGSCQGDGELFRASGGSTLPMAYIAFESEGAALAFYRWLVSCHPEAGQGQVLFSSQGVEERFYFVSFDPGFLVG